MFGKSSHNHKEECPKIIQCLMSVIECHMWFEAKFMSVCPCLRLVQPKSSQSCDIIRAPARTKGPSTADPSFTRSSSVCVVLDSESSAREEMTIGCLVPSFHIPHYWLIEYSSTSSTLFCLGCHFFGIYYEQSVERYSWNDTEHLYSPRNCVKTFGRDGSSCCVILIIHVLWRICISITLIVDCWSFDMSWCGDCLLCSIQCLVFDHALFVILGWIRHDYRECHFHITRMFGECPCSWYYYYYER